MATDFAIWGPIGRGDLSGLSERVWTLLGGTTGSVARCDVAGVEPDAVTIDALARLQLAARRLGCQVRLRNASVELIQLVAFMGLTDVLPDEHEPQQGGTMSTNRKLFVNLAVGDLGRSVDFFTTLGFSFDPRFTDENATCMLVGEDAYFMLLVASRFGDFTKQELVDSHRQTEAILALTAESREEVDTFADLALASGGSPANDPTEIPDFMYGRSFRDPDGHHWEIFWMNPAALEQMG